MYDTGVHVASLSRGESTRRRRDRYRGERSDRSPSRAPSRKSRREEIASIPPPQPPAAKRASKGHELRAASREERRIFSATAVPRIQGLTSLGPLRESRGRFRPTRASDKGERVTRVLSRAARARESERAGAVARGSAREDGRRCEEGGENAAKRAAGVSEPREALCDD